MKRRKGCLHCHTTRTDGDYSVEDLKNMYKEAGYEFIAITDHRLYYHQHHEDFDVLSGCEYNCYLDLHQRYHFHLLTINNGHSTIAHDDNSYKGLYFTKLKHVQDFINELKSRENLVFIAHPMNPLIPVEMLESVNHYDGIEIFNTKAGSDASSVYERLLKTKDLLCLATDDAHQLYQNEKLMFYQGFIVIEDHVSPLDALLGGMYYSSTGIFIDAIEYDNKTIKVHTSALVTIYLYEENKMRKVRSSEVLIERAKAFRVVCQEGDKRAWSNVITI